MKDAVAMQVHEPSPGRWTTRDVMVAVAISIAMTIAFVPLNSIQTALFAISPVFGWAMGGLFRIPRVFIGYVIRKPGAILLFGLIVGLGATVASGFGLFALLAALADGLMAEVSTWIATRYRRFRDRDIALSSVLHAILVIIVAGIIFRSLFIEWPLAIAAAASAIITYVIGGLLATRLARLIAGTGVLRSTAFGATLGGDEI